MKIVWRIYCNGREFGQDYTRKEAIEIAAQYRRLYRHCRYRIRKVVIKSEKTQ